MIKIFLKETKRKLRNGGGKLAENEMPDQDREC